MSITGDINDFTARAKETVSFHKLSRVLAASLADASSSVNARSESGKTLGAHIVAVDDLEAPTEAAVYISSGDTETSVWKVSTILLGTGQVDVTPA